MVKYMEKIMLEVTEGKRGSSYPALKKLGARPGEGSKSWFQLPSHVDRNLSPAQSAEVIAEHFTSISQELSPFDISRLPPNTQAYLLTQDQMLAPELSTQDVFKRITKAKKPNSQVPGDLPIKLVKTFSEYLATPVKTIYNKITKTALFPSQWKIEFQIPLPKVFPQKMKTS